MSTLTKLSKGLWVAIRTDATRTLTQRSISTTPCLGKDEEPGFLSKLISGNPKLTTQSHSSVLSDKKEVYELQVHCVKPECMQDYLAEYERFVNMMSAKTGAQIAGSWTVDIGEQDEAIHLWKFPGGYPVLNEATHIYRTDTDFQEYRKNRNTMLRSRKNEILLPFKFWGEIQPREGKWIYEMRSYALKHGKSLEWGASWQNYYERLKRIQEIESDSEGERGIKHRNEENEKVAGFYTHIGLSTQVHHFWAYKSLQSRDYVRGMAWNKPGWNDCVSQTVPLIRHINSRVMVPAPFSPLQ